MSRVGKYPITIPAGVDVKINGNEVAVKGKLGEMKFSFDDKAVEVSLKDGKVVVEPKGNSIKNRTFWGTTRAQINRLVKGVSEGFSKNLELVGVGYKAAAQGKVLKLSLGFSHEVLYDIPAGIAIATPSPTAIEIKGIDSQQVGQVASEIRKYRKPEPYKGKGIKYSGEVIITKQGKKK